MLGWGAHARTEPRLAREEGDWPGGFLELSPAVPELSPSRPQAVPKPEAGQGAAPASELLNPRVSHLGRKHNSSSSCWGVYFVRDFHKLCAG